MITQQQETPQTCATCPFARHLDGDRYVCTAVHNHHNQVTRGHWEATADCESAIVEQTTPESEENDEQGDDRASVDYVMALETALERSEVQAIQQERFSELTATAAYGIEIDSIKPDSYRVWAGSSLLGTMRRTSAGWLARPSSGSKSWHRTPDDAQHAVVTDALIP